MLNTFETEKEAVLNIIVTTESNRPGRRVDSHCYKRTKDEINFDHHKYTEQIIE